MRILLTGASSFTGFWFAKTLALAGHEVAATLRRPVSEYEGVRLRRAGQLEEHGRVVAGVSFGDDRFLDLLDEGGWDILCHHAADVSNYKSPDFDVLAAVENNTRNVARILDRLREGGGRRIVLTGSVFEGGEGIGSDGLPAFSAYGLSKELTSRVFDYYCGIKGVSFEKFVIPNPFGPLEEPRFTHYLMRNWSQGDSAAVNTPDYVRDNIHVSLLASAYADFVSNPDSHHSRKLNPCGYVESQGAFAQRFAVEMRQRLGWACELDLRRQEDFPEPRVRINTDRCAVDKLGWDELKAWDELADYYRRTFEDDD
jgi:nucleoside-diphosphate-sugar epimerase